MLEAVATVKLIIKQNLNFENNYLKNNYYIYIEMVRTANAKNKKFYTFRIINSPGPDGNRESGMNHSQLNMANSLSPSPRSSETLILLSIFSI